MAQSKPYGQQRVWEHSPPTPPLPPDPSDLTV